MKNIRIFLSVMVLATISVIVHSQDYHVRIGTIGNSITHGIAIANPEANAYPIQLRDTLAMTFGDTCIVRNFGLTTTTMLKNGDVSYWDTQEFKDYLAWAPEICLILLGTNDSKPQNWDDYGDEFIDDYLSMIDTIKMRNPFTKFMLGYPPPAFDVVWGIRDSIIVNGVIPAIDSVLILEANTVLMDFYNPMLDDSLLFPDHIHPNIEGNTVMAQLLRDRMIETDIIHEAVTGVTLITEYETDKTPLPIGDSATLSWTTINADTVKLNGEVVVDNGSIKVSPAATTEYTLIAKGTIWSDTISLTQEMYTPELTRLRITPAKSSGYANDTTYFALIYYDQMNQEMPTTYNVDWSIVSGTAYFYNESDTGAYLISVAGDTTLFSASYGSLADTATIVAWPLDAVKDNTFRGEVKVFPNPCNEMLNFGLEILTGPLSVQLYDLNGVMRLQEEFIATSSGYQTFNLDTSLVPEGNYILKLEHSGMIYTEKLLIHKE